MAHESETPQVFTGRKMVTRTVGKKNTAGTTVEVSEPLEVKVFAPGIEVAHVRVNNGATINIGNYQSLRVDISIDIPCYKEEVPDAIIAVSDLISEYFGDEIEKVKRDIEERG